MYEYQAVMGRELEFGHEYPSQRYDFIGVEGEKRWSWNIIGVDSQLRERITGEIGIVFVFRFHGV